MFENQPSADTAAQLIADNDGSRRNAELFAWQQHDSYEKGHPGQSYWIQVIRCIVDHQETTVDADHEIRFDERKFAIDPRVIDPRDSYYA
jgi:hypothetical protein